MLSFRKGSLFIVKVLLDLDPSFIAAVTVFFLCMSKISFQSSILSSNSIIAGNFVLLYLFNLTLLLLKNKVLLLKQPEVMNLSDNYSFRLGFASIEATSSFLTQWKVTWEGFSLVLSSKVDVIIVSRSCYFPYWDEVSLQATFLELRLLEFSAKFNLYMCVSEVFVIDVLLFLFFFFFKFP